MGNFLDCWPQRYCVHSTDRKRRRTIIATSPNRAAGIFLGRRCATLRLNCWTPDEREHIFDASVRVGPGPFRMGKDAVKNISVFVELTHA